MNSRRLAIIILVLLTVVLIAVTGFIAYRIQQEAEVPVAGEFGTSCTPGGEIECQSGICCNCGKCAGTGGAGQSCAVLCGCANDTQCEGMVPGDPDRDLGCQGNNQPFRCKCTAVACGTGPGRFAVNCATPDNACTASSGGGPTTTTTTGGTTAPTTGSSACQISNPSVVDSYIDIGDACPSNFPYNIRVFVQAAPPGSTSENCTAAGQNPTNPDIDGSPGNQYFASSCSSGCSSSAT